MTNRNTLLTSVEVGHMIGRSSRTVLRFASLGPADQDHLPHVQRLAGTAGSYLFDQSAVRAWMDSHPQYRPVESVAA